MSYRPLITPASDHMERLVMSFPSLNKCRRNWSPQNLIDWADYYTSPSQRQARHAVAFVLGVAQSPHPRYPFDFHQAWKDWDAAHREAALAWMNAPFLLEPSR